MEDNFNLYVGDPVPLVFMYQKLNKRTDSIHAARESILNFGKLIEMVTVTEGKRLSVCVEIIALIESMIEHRGYCLRCRDHAYEGEN